MEYAVIAIWDWSIANRCCVNFCGPLSSSELASGFNGIHLIYLELILTRCGCSLLHNKKRREKNLLWFFFSFFRWRWQLWLQFVYSKIAIVSQNHQQIWNTPTKWKLSAELFALGANKFFSHFFPLQRWFVLCFVECRSSSDNNNTVTSSRGSNNKRRFYEII